MNDFTYYADNLKIPVLPEELCMSGLKELSKNMKIYSDENFMRERWLRIKQQWPNLDESHTELAEYLDIQKDKSYNQWVNQQLVDTRPVLYSLQEFAETKPTLITQKDGSEQAASGYHRVEGFKEHYDWVYENIPELKGHLNEVGFQVIDNKHHHPNGATFAIHTDGVRGQHVIAFNLDVGGPNVPTRWYHEHDQPLVRPQGTKRISLRNLDQLTEVVFMPGVWCMLRANILHTVHSVLTERIAFTIGFSNYELYQELAKKYS